MGKKSFFDNLGSIFVKPDEAEAEVIHQQEAEGVVPNVEPDNSNDSDLMFSPAIVKQATEGNIVGVFDKAIYSQLQAAIIEKDLPGDDYLEFKSSLKKLAVYIPDEAKLYKATFDSLNLNVESLLKSLTHYIDVVSGEKEKFKVGLQGAVEQQVGKKEVELQEIVDKRVALKTQIEEIEAEITGLNEYENTVSIDLQQAKTKLMVTDANFNITVEKLTTQLTGDSAKIEKHLVVSEEVTK